MNLNKSIKRIFAVLSLAMIAICALLSLAVKPTFASDPYSFEIEKYELVYDVRADRTMSVSESVTIHFTGSKSTGFYRYIPVNAGDRVTKVDVLDGDGGRADYDVLMEESDFITLSVGDYSNKTGGTYAYIIKYDYAITRPEKENLISLNAVGFGTGATVRDVDVTINLPEGIKFENGKPAIKYYAGKVGTTEESYDYTFVNNVITAHYDEFSNYSGMTFYITYEDGVLSTRFDFTPYIMIIIGCVLLAALFAVKFLFFSKKPLTPVVNFTAPDDMDPLVMGKLIDNKVNTEDVTSLIYYWANKGYLKISLEDEDDPLLIRIYKNLPEGTPEHQKVMFNDLFAGGGRVKASAFTESFYRPEESAAKSADSDEVKISSLSGKFYNTVEKVTKMVNESNKGLYESKSIGISIIFALLGGLVMGATPVAVAMINISPSLFFYPALLALVPAFVIYGLTETYAYYRLKATKVVRVGLVAGLIALCAAFTGLYVLIMPSAIMEIAPKILVCVIGYAMVMLSVWLINRTDEYSDKLNHILGFRNFILYAEKDRLEKMLEDDPQFYYHVLPYAQVLGVSDIWEEKFAALTVAPPVWMIDPFDTYLSFVVINRAIRVSTTHMVSNMSRPASSGMSGGGGFGGGGGGFAGGGHGGGGFGGR